MSGESDLIDELRLLAGAGDLGRFTLARGPRVIEVDYTSGSSSSLLLRARYDAVARADHPAIEGDRAPVVYRQTARVTGMTAIRPLAITLRGETEDDVGGKASGVNVEFQTGDEAFDRAVYVSTPTTDAAVLRAVLGPEVRHGTRALLDLGFRRVEIDDEHGDVTALLCEFAQREPTPGRGLRAIEAFDRVLSDLPRVATAKGAHAPVPGWTNAMPFFVAAVLGVMVAVPATCGVADERHCMSSDSFRDGCGWPPAVAAPLAIALAFVARSVFTKRATAALRGRSDAQERIGKLATAVFLATAIVGFILADCAGYLLARPTGF